MLIILTGNGKGKTTSAIGTALRAVGWGHKTAVVFFDKGGDHYGETKALVNVPEVDVFRFGLPRFDEASQTFRFENVPGDFTEAVKALDQVEVLLGQGYFLIVADELISALSLGLIGEVRVREAIAKHPGKTHLLLTGRGAPDWLVEQADLVSEVKEIKHYFKKNTSAIRGIDY